MKAIIAGAIVFCLVLIGAGYYFATKPVETGPRIIPFSDQYRIREKNGGWTRGVENPTVTVIEYADMQCPACKNFNPIIDEVYTQTKDIAQFQFRHYPLLTIHNKALIGAKATEAAGRQGKFWEMEDLLFNSQESWEASLPSSFNTTVKQAAESLSLNMDQFNKDLKDATVQDQIDRDMVEGDKIFPQSGPSTPTFVINGTRLAQNPQTVDEFVALIKQAATPDAGR